MPEAFIQTLNVPQVEKNIEVSIPDGTAKSSALFSALPEALRANPYFNAGAGLAGIGLVMGVARRVLVISNAFFRRRFMINFMIDNKDPAYSWLLDFINRRSSQQTRSISAVTHVKQAESGRTVVDFSFLPSHGFHYFTYKWRWIKLERQREKQTISEPGGYRTPLETVTLTTLGSDPQFFKTMIRDATTEAVSALFCKIWKERESFLENIGKEHFESDTGLVLYRAAGPEWRRAGAPQQKRSLDSVVLKGDTAENIVADFHDFINSADWYTKRGVPYRRGYLFHGPPGTGKSSFIYALASHFGYSICILSLSERTLDDERLDHLLNSPPANSIIVLEDIDAAFSTTPDPMDKHPAYQGLTRVTFYGLLNAIDGIVRGKERVLFMTTNHVERLDPALIRPGRVDVEEHFGFADQDMARKMFIRFYSPLPEGDENLVSEFVEAAFSHPGEISTAALQGHFLKYKTSPRDACDNAHLVLKHRS